MGKCKMANCTKDEKKKFQKLIILPNFARSNRLRAAKFLCKMHKMQHFLIKI
jgi:hypothetical protein